MMRTVLIAILLCGVAQAQEQKLQRDPSTVSRAPTSLYAMVACYAFTEGNIPALFS
jgi:hypothetical protein